MAKGDGHRKEKKKPKGKRSKKIVLFTKSGQCVLILLSRD